MKNPIVGVIAGIVIFFCAVYIGINIKNSGWLEPQTAAALNSKLSATQVESKAASIKNIADIVGKDDSLKDPLKGETDVTITGIIDAVQFDDFDKHENSHVEYFLTVGDERFSLHPTSDLLINSGHTFKVTGKKTGNIIVADSKDIVNVENFGGGTNGGSGGAGDGPTGGHPDSVGDQKTLALLVRYQDSPNVPISNPGLYDLIFKGQFQKFYKEQSYGNVSFSGKVMGWYTLPRNCNGAWPTFYPQLTHELDDLLVANNIDLGDYDRLLLIAQSTEGSGGCLSGIRGWSSLGKMTLPVGFRKYKISISAAAISNYYLSTPYPFSSIPLPALNLFESVLIHEAGHGLGVRHANVLDCGEVSFGTNCDHAEYGNPFDTMGGEALSLHFNAFYKELLGWIPPQNVVSITRSGKYTINNLETAGPKQKYFAKIQRPDSTSAPYYLEYRRAIGFDGWLNYPIYASNQSGLLVNLVRKNPATVASFPHLLDMQPTSYPLYQDIQKATLNVGAEFADPSNGIKIGPVISVSTSSITFDVTIDKPKCVPRSPSMWLFPPVSLSIVAGQTGQANISFQNADSITCEDSKFNVETNAPSDWQRQVIPAGDVALHPTESYYPEVTKNINLTVPPNTPGGTYPTTFSVVNRTTGYRKDYQININVVGAPVIYNINPASGPVGTPVVIAGTFFSSFPKVIMIGAQGRFSSNFQSGGSIISFQVPATITEPFCNCAIPTPPGFYDTYVYANGMLSLPTTFEVTQ